MSLDAAVQYELLLAPTTALPMPPKYLVATHFKTTKTLTNVYDVLNAYLPYKEAAYRPAADGGVYVEVWIVGDFARLKIGVYRDDEGLVIELTKMKGSGTLISRMFQQIKFLLDSEAPVLFDVTKTPSLQPFRPQSDDSSTVSKAHFDRTVETMLTHLHKPSHDLVLHAAQYFAALSEQHFTAEACASSAPLIAGLLSVLDLDRTLPLECRTSASQALLLMCMGPHCADFVAIAAPLQLNERLEAWRTYLPDCMEADHLRRHCNAMLSKLMW